MKEKGGTEMQYGIVTGFIFFIDFFLKKKADGLKRLGKWRSYWNDRIEVWKYHNHGGFYNLGQGKPDVVRGISLGLSAVAFVCFLLSLTFHGNRMLRSGLSILLGGAFSNAYDRLTKRYVVDYLRLPKIPILEKIIFNLSDFCILIGAMFTAIACSKEETSEK